MHDMNNNFRYRLGYVLRDSFEASIGINFREGLQLAVIDSKRHV